MKILHTADWHIDQSNIDFTAPVIEEAIANAPDYDVFVHAGDLAVHRGHVNPRVAYVIRRLIDQAHRKAKHGSIIIAGNHDLNFKNDGAGMVAGILGHDRLTTGTDQTMHLVETARTINIDGTNFVCIPTPSKFALAEWEQNHKEIGEAYGQEGLLEQAIQGLIIDATFGKHDPCLVVYHGTVSGAKLGNEMVMKSGVDLAVPHTAFRGADAVLAGHVHHQQLLRKKPIVFYPGAAAPLTWNDVILEPAMYLHTNDAEGHRMTILPIRVASQLIDAELDASIADDGLRGEPPLPLLTYMLAAMPDAGPGDRVRLRVKAPGYMIEGVPRDAPDRLVQASEAATVKVIYERTDVATAKVVLDKEWDIEKAFWSWGEMKGLTPKQISMTQGQVIQKVEAAVIDSDLEADFECKPISITAKNWCQYDEARIYFDDIGKVTAVTGPNYVGKSNLMRLFLFSRYKKQVSGDKLADLIQIGADGCTVDEVFEHRGNRYNIVRTLKRTAAGGTRTDLQFYVYDDGDWKCINEETAAATQDAIEFLIGPYDLFRATSYAGQNDVDGLLDLTPSDLKDVLLSVLHMDFDSRLDIIKEKARSLELSRDLVLLDAGRRETIENEIKECKRSADALLDTRSTQEHARAKASEFNAQAARALERAKEALQEAKRDGEKRAEATNRISKIQKEITGLEYEIGLCKAAARTNTDPAAIAEIPSASEVTRLSAKRDLAIGSLERARDQRTECREAGDDAIKSAEQIRDEAVGKRTAIENQIQDLQRQVQECESSVTIKAIVPCMGGEFSNGVTGGTVDMGLCQFLVNAKLAEGLLPVLVADIAAREREFTGATAKWKAAKATLNDVNWQASIQNEDAKKNVLVVKAMFEAEHKAFTEASLARNKGQAAIEAKERADHEEEKLKIFTDRHDAIHFDLVVETERLKAMVDTPSIEDAVQLRDAGAVALQKGVKALEEAVELCYTTETALASVGGASKAWKKQLDEIGDVKERLDTLAESIELWHIAEEAMHRDGIPYLLLEQFAIPVLHETINAYLGNTDIRVSIDNERELVSGKVRNEVVLMFEDHRGIHPLSAASGFQRTAIGMALRNALADLHARATGSRIWLSIQDEGFGTMDQGNLDKVKATIAQIAEQRGYFIFISHIPGMAEIADSEIAVRENGGTSIAATGGSNIEAS
jgi:DNA repair exonuclease SbcCD ATPase subunit/predicted phosphodiesterase